MEIVDAFKSCFDMTTLTHSIQHQDFIPGRIASLGLFDPEPIQTITAVVEEEYGTITLAPTAPRGGVSDPTSRDRRKVRSFAVPHIPLVSQVQADEVQNIRGFGMNNRASAEMASVEMVRDKKLQKMRQRLEATIEYHRMGAIKGVILDSDGLTTVFNLFTEFDVTQSTLGMDLDVDATEVTTQIREATRLSENALGNSVVQGFHAFCGDTFYDTLITHPNVKEWFRNHPEARVYRDEARAYATFWFGGVTWENYRGSVGGVAFVPATKAYLVPLGVPELFIHYMAPADYVETVNTPGEPYYAKSELMPMGKGIKIEAQANPLCLCTKPAAVVELDATGS